MAASRTDSADNKRVLIVKPSSFGDIIHSLPVLASIKNSRPNWRVDWLANSAFADFLSGVEGINEVLAFPRDKFRGFFGVVKFFYWLAKIRRNCQYDLVLDLQGLFRSAFISKLLTKKNGKTLGLLPTRELAHLFYDEAHGSGEGHAVKRYLVILEILGINLPTEEKLDFLIPFGDKPSFVSKLPRDFIVLHPFARGGGKSLSATVTRHFIEYFTKSKCKLILLGQGSKGIRSEQNADNDFLNDYEFNFLDKTTLLELCWLLRKARFCLSIDSGPAHLAAGISVNTLTIFSWANPAKVGTFEKNSWFWKGGRIFRACEIPSDLAVEDRSARKLDKAIDISQAEVKKISDFVLELIDEKAAL